MVVPLKITFAICVERANTRVQQPPMLTARVYRVERVFTVSIRARRMQMHVTRVHGENGPVRKVRVLKALVMHVRWVNMKLTPATGDVPAIPPGHVQPSLPLYVSNVCRASSRAQPAPPLVRHVTSVLLVSIQKAPPRHVSRVLLASTQAYPAPPLVRHVTSVLLARSQTALPRHVSDVELTSIKT